MNWVKHHEKTWRKRLPAREKSITWKGAIHIPGVAILERVGRQMARDRGLTYTPSNVGEYVSGQLTGVANLVSGRFAMIENGLGFQLVPWNAVCCLIASSSWIQLVPQVPLIFELVT
jgi:hypothetical protein